MNLSDDYGVKLALETQKSLTDLSICFRFFNYRIGKYHLMSQRVNGLVSEKQLEFFSEVEWSADGTKLFLYQKFNGKFIQPEHPDSGWRMTPREWHTYCLTYHQDHKHVKVYIDAELVLADVMDTNFESTINDWFVNNITFMPKAYGAEWSSLDLMTDINVWNVTLQTDDIETWTNCRSKIVESKIISWMMAEWKLKDVREVQIKHSEICRDKNKANIHNFKIAKTFLESVDFCHLLGGHIFVAETNEALKILMDMCEDAYAGIID